MTFVSLLFSIYQVKASPFCELDELDAPLDESNINRFIRVLQQFLAHSQFIIITHNKPVPRQRESPRENAKNAKVEEDFFCALCVLLRPSLCW